jgi:hypothetical protein
MGTIEKLRKIRDNTNNPKLKASLKKKIAILEGDKTVRK